MPRLPGIRIEAILRADRIRAIVDVLQSYAGVVAGDVERAAVVVDGERDVPGRGVFGHCDMDSQTSPAAVAHCVRGGFLADAVERGGDVAGQVVDRAFD